MQLRKRLIVVSDFDFSKKGGAAYSRLVCYAKAIEEKFDVFITDKANINGTNCCKVEKIQNNITLLFSEEKSVKSKFYRIFLRHFDFTGSYKYIHNIVFRLKSDEDKEDLFLLYGSDLALHVTALVYLKLFKKRKVILEKNELEIGILLNQGIFSRSNFVIAPLIFPLLFLCSLVVDSIVPCFSKVIVISKRLQSLYFNCKSKLLYIPILYDNSGYNLTVKKENSDKFCIGFTGIISQQKDGDLDLVKALGLIPFSIRKNIVLNIYGTGNKSDIKKFNEEIVRNKLQELVIFNDMVETNKIPQILMRNDLLVLTRPSNLQTNYGFSTKLAEYLASGVPVLTTKVSDNSLYLIDGQNALLVEPEDVNSISDKIQYAIMNNNKLKIVGLKGKETAQKYFSNKNYSRQLIDFLSI
jgi:glycosyltransferase involved in cell wall biosynthesis